jgi:3-phosphoshikimate 1-carboxyvinyltransferase
MMTLRVRPRPGVPLVPPVSKSDALRWLALRALDGDALGNATPDEPEDVTRFRAGLGALGGATDCGDGGAPLRFLTAFAALHPGTTVLTGSPRLGARPIGPLLDALRSLVDCRFDGPWPLVVTGTGARARTDRIHVDGSLSSQFASALWLAAAALHRREGRPFAVHRTGAPASDGYLALTLRWLRAAGHDLDGAWIVGHRPATLPAPPRDWSGAASLAPVAWAFGCDIAIDAEAEHPDRALLPALAEAGLDVHLSRTLRVSGTARRGLRHSASGAPDLVPILVAWATALPGPSVFTDLAGLRGKESDRLAGVVALALAAGARVEGDASRLTVHPARASSSIDVRVSGDHRMVFAAAALSALHGCDVRIDAPDAQRKSFPTFLDQVAPGGRSDLER